MTKKRSIQQKSEAISKAALMLLFSDWPLNPLNNEDFGFDFEARIANRIKDSKTQEISGISFYIQNKSTINSKGDKAEEDLKIDDWELYLETNIPVLVVKYDIPQKIFFWEIAQEYVWDVLDKKDPNWKLQKTKRITFAKKITDLDELKKAIINSQKRIIKKQALNLGIGEGIKITDDDLSELKKNLY